MAKQLRSLGSTNVTGGNVNHVFNERLKSCITVVRSCKNEIPSCVKYIASLLLQPEQLNLQDFKYPSVTDLGLPPPSAHLLLEPLLNRNIPFTPRYLILYNLLKNLKDFENITQELDILYHFDCNGLMCLEYENIERAKILFEQTIGECKVKSCARNLQYLLEDLNTTTDIEIVQLLVPYVKIMIEEPPTSVLAAWYLFDPIARVLGPRKTSEIFLDSLLKLYESEPSESTIPYNSKIAKLYHHSFLLRLIVRFGLKCFLDHFVTSLVEAIGGYRDYDKVDFILHTHEKVVRKTSHLKAIDHEEEGLSPSDDSSYSSEKNIAPPKQEGDKVESEPEVFDFDNEDLQEQEPLQSIIEHLELNVASDLPYVPQAEEALDALNENDQMKNLEELNLNLNENYDDKPGLISPTIPIPPSYKQQDLNNITCDIGSKKSETEFSFDKKSDSLNFKTSPELSSVNNERRKSLDNIYSTSVESETCSFLSKSNLKRKQDCKISDMSCDSLIWLSHRLGPVLTARYLSRNLLKMLTLCYVGKENLGPPHKDFSTSTESDVVNVANSIVVGDINAFKVLDCLGSIAALYGEQIILLQYFPHMRELIALCKRKLTPNLEGGLISCLALLKHIIPYLSDSTLMTHLHEEILVHILLPCVRLLGSTKYTFPSGAISRNSLARKYIDTLYVLSLRMGADNTRIHLAVPFLQRFFLIFEKIREDGDYNSIQESITKANLKHSEENHFVEVKKDGSTTEWTLRGKPPHIIQVRLLDSDSTDSLSPPVTGMSSTLETTMKAMDELKIVFTSELAHTAYMPFLKQIGCASLEISLKNHSTIHNLCQKYQEEENINTDIKTIEIKNLEPQPSTSIGSNVALIGNRIDVQIQSEEGDVKTGDILSQISNKMDNTSRHLRGNWLAYWEHEIGRSEKDVMFNFKQIKLQTFTGHASSVKTLCVLDNENSFLSGSREKTVKLWSLRSQGDGSSVSTCQWTYTSHRKSIMALTFIESFRLVASCDGIVHIWDPFIGQLVGLLENPKYPPVNTIKAMPAPSCLVFAATTEGILRVIDTRTCSYTHDLKVNVNQGNLIRCLAIAKSGLWIAAGQSSGHITVLDSRTGQILATWRAHESEVLQLVPVGEDTLISSSLDQTICVWNVQDGKFNFHMK
ncbi:wd repeat-containing protein 81 [Holotrichia oblita]|uniref:Wd repeat-containing protein 81 n=1 Tax=Holotrichia oblita TaxID=644536 RepID=A0ACB9SRY6_HOLOL|nr:wd repeat-containing protein 81 [Holotrichia oblita]